MSLELHRAAFAYPHGRWIFQGLELELRPGEVLCLLGPNGGGKTTLLKTLCGLLPLSGGQVRYAGTPLAKLGRRALARRVGFIPQAQEQVHPFRVRELVLMGRTPHMDPFSVPSPQDERLADEALESMGLSDLAGARFLELSGGERALVLLARALCQAPQCLLLDEPLAHLDLANQMRVLELMHQRAAAGWALAFTTHDPAHAFSQAHRVALLKRGEALLVGTPEQVLTAGTLSEVYGARVEVLRMEPPDGPEAFLVRVRRP
jgi:iron complex transport system ATP-binding protein